MPIYAKWKVRSERDRGNSADRDTYELWLASSHFEREGWGTSAMTMAIDMSNREYFNSNDSLPSARARGSIKTRTKSPGWLEVQVEFVYSNSNEIFSVQTMKDKSNSGACLFIYHCLSIYQEPFCPPQLTTQLSFGE